MGAFADAIEAIAGRHYPGVEGRPFQIAAEVFEYRGMLGRDRREVVEGLVYSGGQAGGRHIVTQDAAVYNLTEEGGARNQLSQEMRDVFAALRQESFFVAGASTKSDHHRLASARQGHRAPWRNAV